MYIVVPSLCLCVCVHCCSFFVCVCVVLFVRAWVCAGLCFAVCTRVDCLSVGQTVCAVCHELYVLCVLCVCANMCVCWVVCVVMCVLHVVY